VVHHITQKSHRQHAEPVLMRGQVFAPARDQAIHPRGKPSAVHGDRMGRRRAPGTRSPKHRDARATRAMRRGVKNGCDRSSSVAYSQVRQFPGSKKGDLFVPLSKSPASPPPLQFAPHPPSDSPPASSNGLRRPRLFCRRPRDATRANRGGKAHARSRRPRQSRRHQGGRNRRPHRVRQVPGAVQG
jgi:hypothetical protein